MNKQVHKYSSIYPEIVKAIDILAEPIRETMSPKGRNVIFETDDGRYVSTNDGATIAKNIQVKDPLHNAIIGFIKGASLKTNTEVGDGTSTSILLSSVLAKEGLRLSQLGFNAMLIKRMLDKALPPLVKSLEKQKRTVKGDDEIYNIAKISANNDDKIAKDVQQTLKVAGLDGMVFINGTNNPDTEIEENVGFNIKQGMFAKELRNQPSQFAAMYAKVPVLVTDKRLYHEEEAETILQTIVEAGYKAVVIVARDFIGKAPNYFIANHLKGNISVLLVKDGRTKDDDNENLEDLATYLGTDLVTEKRGRLVDNLTIDDFCMAETVYSDGMKTIITSPVRTKKLENRIKAVRKELKADKDNETLKERLASMTSGMVTIKVGAATPVEMSEKCYRYEDAVSAARAAMRDGVLVGGGVALYKAFLATVFPEEVLPIVPAIKAVCEANLRQIALNCGRNPDSILEKVQANKSSSFGYNAMTDEFGDLWEEGVIDPYKVTEMAVVNSFSVASQIIGSGHLIINDTADVDNNDSKK